MIFLHVDINYPWVAKTCTTLVLYGFPKCVLFCFVGWQQPEVENYLSKVYSLKFTVPNFGLVGGKKMSVLGEWTSIKKRFWILRTRKSRRNSVRAQLTFSVPVAARFWTFSLGMAKLHSENINQLYFLVFPAYIFYKDYKSRV